MKVGGQGNVIKLLSARGIRIGTDGQDAGRDAVVVEHLWRTSEDAEVAYVSMPGLAAIPASATAAACKVFGAGWSAAAFTFAARDKSA